MVRTSFATRWNLDAVESAYSSWKKDPASVDSSWQVFFEGFELGAKRQAVAAPENRDQAKIALLVNTYRDLGHLLAHLDPLSDRRKSHPLLELSEFGLESADSDRTFDAHPFRGWQKATLSQIVDALRETYCRTVGVEYMHIRDTRIRRWLQERMEPRRNHPHFDSGKKRWILKSLHYAELFERFLHIRFVGQKRF